MKVVILGGGFGTRLEKDLKKNKSPEYASLIGVPKPLLPIGRYPLITHWMNILIGTGRTSSVFVVTNATNHKQFVEWKKNWPTVRLICDRNATTNETRSGAVACIELAIREGRIRDDLLVIAGDTLFRDDFNLGYYITRFDAFKAQDKKASMLVYVECAVENVHKYGILETDERHQVRDFLEKPNPSETSSRKECPCFYFLNKASLPLISEFLEEKKDEPLKNRDATGNFIGYLHKKMPVYAAEISGRFDVGGLQTYIKCNEYFAGVKTFLYSEEKGKQVRLSIKRRTDDELD